LTQIALITQKTLKIKQRKVRVLHACEAAVYPFSVICEICAICVKELNHA